MRRGRDHPRSRGVYPGGRVCGRLGWRIIPARAGFTEDGSIDGYRGEDHPRSRGVYMTAMNNSYASYGSSPLARGLHTVGSTIVGQYGIIPARAGFTCMEGVADASSTDHPRSRGVYLKDPADRLPETGSSPLARGLLGGCRMKQEITGIIPARAGFTRIERRAQKEVGDHPRSRGVYSW